MVERSWGHGLWPLRNWVLRCYTILLATKSDMTCRIKSKWEIPAATLRLLYKNLSPFWAFSHSANNHTHIGQCKAESSGCSHWFPGIYCWAVVICSHVLPCIHMCSQNKICCWVTSQRHDTYIVWQHQAMQTNLY